MKTVRCFFAFVLGGAGAFAAAPSWDNEKAKFLNTIQDTQVLNAWKSLSAKDSKISSEQQQDYAVFLMKVRADVQVLFPIAQQGGFKKRLGFLSQALAQVDWRRVDQVIAQKEAVVIAPGGPGDLLQTPILPNSEAGVVLALQELAKQDISAQNAQSLPHAIQLIDSVVRKNADGTYDENHVSHLICHAGCAGLTAMLMGHYRDQQEKLKKAAKK